MEVDATVTEVEGIIQDATYDADWIIAKFNECLNLVATMFRIPGLQTSGAVSAVLATLTAAMPKNYLHDLYMVTSGTFPQGLLIAPNIKELTYSYNSEQEGDAAMVSLDGSILHFRPKPTATETLTLHYYRKPTELSAGDDFPDYIPEILQKALFQNYAAAEAYLLIEDGIDGKKINHEKYAGLFGGGLSGLSAFFPNAPKARPVLRRGGSFF